MTRHLRSATWIGAVFLIGVAVSTGVAGCTSNPATEQPTVSSSEPSFRSAHCSGSALSGTIAEGDGGAAGSQLPFIIVTNTSEKSCTLTGWPTIALVAQAHGDAIGASSQRNAIVAHPAVTLPPHGTARIPVRITQALNFPTDTCQPTPAGGLRINPPGVSSSFFVAYPNLTACINPQVKLLTVSAVLPAA